MSQTELASHLDFLERHAPFQQMAVAHREFLAKRLRVGFYAAGDAVLSPEDGPVDRLFIIKQGSVRAATAGSDEAVWEGGAGESFPLAALSARRAVRTVHRATTDTFCFELPREDFDTLLAQSPPLAEFCSHGVHTLLDQALRQVQSRSATRLSADTSLNTPLGALIGRAPVTCAPDALIRDVLTLMETRRIGSVVITDPAQRPIGIFTLHDVLSRVALPEVAIDRPVSEVMTADPCSLAPTDFAFQAALTMTRRGFGHLCIVEDGKLVGVISERDLFSLQRIGLVRLSRTVAEAKSDTDLARVTAGIHKLTDQLLAQGASVSQLTQIITTVNDQITRRVIELGMAAVGRPQSGFVWLSFGSEGRDEQTLKTDQDNGILFAADPARDVEAQRAELLALGEWVTRTLDRIGFPLCRGNVMASNPELVLTLEEWQARFARWIDQGTPDHLMKATIFFDFRPLTGRMDLAAALRGWLAERVQVPRFLRMLAGMALQNRPPLGLLRDFQLSADADGSNPHTLDLKIRGLTPFVDGARILALASGIGETNTVRRLRAAADRGALPAEEAAALIEAYEFIQLLRMRHHRQQIRAEQTLSNRVDPDALNELDRRILKEALRQARKLQSKLEVRYQL